MSGGYNPAPNPLPMSMGGTGQSTIAPLTTVAGLPPASANGGKLYIVTDALLPALGAIIVGGGAVKVVVFSDANNWIAA